jgi:16S rRNA (cytosine1402-N4)-methyltransferase
MEHFKDWERGFSLNFDSKLDMRFDNKSWKSAYDILNTYSSNDLTRTFVEYAEFTPQKSQEISHKIIEYRKKSPINTTFDLKKILNQVGLGQKASVVIFQAIRIETNKEIDNLKLFLESIPNILSKGWRCGIITFHSIEDRIVKNYFKDISKLDWFSLVSKKAIKPNYKEVQKNRASRSAKYRVIEKNI